MAKTGFLYRRICRQGNLQTDNGDAEGLITFYQKGLTRAIGVCNLEVHHMEKLLNNPKCTVLPAINQSHFHPLHAATELRNYCAEKGIAFGGLFEDSELSIPTKPRIHTDTNRYGLLFQTDDDHILANQKVRIDPSRRSAEYQYDPYVRQKIRGVKIRSSMMILMNSVKSLHTMERQIRRW